MAINPVSSNAAQTVAASQTADAYNQLDGGAFMQLLLTQMKHQNPLEPMEDREFMSQVTQLNSLKQLEQMNNTLKTLLAKAEPKPDLAQAATLIGKQVEAKDAKGQAVTGVVSSVRLQDNAIWLTVNGVQVSLKSVSSVTTPLAPATAAPKAMNVERV